MSKFIVQKELFAELFLNENRSEQDRLGLYVLKRIRDGIAKEANGELPKEKDKLDRAALYEMTKQKNEFSLTERDLHRLTEKKTEIKGIDKLKSILNFLSKMGYIRIKKREREHDVGRPPAPLIRLTRRWFDLEEFNNLSEAKNYLTHRELEPEKCRIIEVKATVRKEIKFE